MQSTSVDDFRVENQQIKKTPEGNLAQFQSN